MPRSTDPALSSRQNRAFGPFDGPELTERERDMLRLVRDDGPVTRAALIRASGLSGPAVFRATEDLAAKGFLLIGAPIAAGRGQPSHEVRLNPDAAYSLGISVMTDRAEAAIMDLTGQVRVRADVTAPGMARQAVLANAAQFFADQQSAGIDRSALVGVGLAVAAFFVEPHLMNPASELEDWALIDLREPVQSTFGAPATVENTASAAAVGESLLGVGRHTPSFAYINFAAGFGGGIILDRRLWRGVTGNAGEFAAILNTIGAFVPNLETLRLRVAAGGVDTNGINDLVARIDLSWPGVESWIEEAAASVKLLARIITETIDVGTIVVGGRLPCALATRVAEAAQINQSDLDLAQRRNRGRPAPKILPAEIDARATAVGAAALPLATYIFAPPAKR